MSKCNEKEKKQTMRHTDQYDDRPTQIICS